MLATFAYSTADTIVRALPRPWTERAARGLARALFAARVPARARLEQNLTRLSPGEACLVRGRALETFEQFALVMTDFLTLGHVSEDGLRQRVVVHGAEHLDAASGHASGCLLVSAHCGCWEWGAAFLSAHGIRLRVLSRPHSSRGVERFFRARRAAWGVRSLDPPPHWAKAAAALRRGEWLGLMGDRGAPGLRGSLCGWASALARRTGAVLLPAAMTRLPDGRHELWFDAPIRGGGDPQALRAALRGHVERARGQWFAFDPLPEGLA